jgi:hypothetical protein
MGSSPTGQTGAVMAVANRLRDYAGDVFKHRKPWTEVVDKNAFSKPQNLAEVRGLPRSCLAARTRSATAARARAQLPARAAL